MEWERARLHAREKEGRGKEEKMREERIREEQKEYCCACYADNRRRNREVDQRL